MDELLLRIALSMTALRPQEQRMLLDTLGSATQLYNELPYLSHLLPNAGKHTKEAIAEMARYVGAAEKEIEFAEQMGVRILTMDDAGYPHRMLHAEDAPTVLYMMGKADLNAKHIVSIVGTRHCTPYGVGLCNDFVDAMRDMVPDVVIFSGLAYGIDIAAHRRCLNNGMPTVGVLAHGLDNLYPGNHRGDARRMCEMNGGLLTEYPHGTKMHKSLFISRNRIVAGCSDATVVVESNEKGGSLHTARMAFDYSRNVYTFPGRVTDRASRGCMDLVYHDVAKLICSAEQFVKAQGWEDCVSKGPQVIQTSLFEEIDDLTRTIIDSMTGEEFVTLEHLQMKTSLPMHLLKKQLVEMELNEVLTVMAGGRYRLSNKYR